MMMMIMIIIIRNELKTICISFKKVQKFALSASGDNTTNNSVKYLNNKKYTIKVSGKCLTI